MNKLWAGRYEQETAKLADDFNSSITFDSRMYKEDITGSMAHAAMLGARGIITQSEVHTVCPRPTEGSPHRQQARVSQLHGHRVADWVLGDLAAGVRDDSADLCRDAGGCERHPEGERGGR